MNDAWDLSVLSLQLPVNLYLLQNKKFKEKKKKKKYTTSKQSSWDFSFTSFYSDTPALQWNNLEICMHLDIL